MTPDPHREYTLDELVSAAAAWLGAAAVVHPDERVRELPDARTLRYYQTLGLLDRPLRYEGRAAVYGARHLLQALAVKVLQAQGLSLAQVQAALLGADTPTLEAAVAEVLGAAGSAAQGPPAPAPSPIPLPQAQPLRSVRLAPGVVLVLDPELVPRPEALIARLARALLDLDPTDPEPGALR